MRLCLLRRHVVDCAHYCVGSSFEFSSGFRLLDGKHGRLFLCHFRQTEIQNLNYTVAAANHHVLRFHIAMNYACFMSTIECGKYLSCDIEDLAKLQSLSAHVVTQRFAVDEFRGQESLPARFAKFEDGENVRLVKR